MSEVFFCSDHHLGHKHIIKYSRTKWFSLDTPIEEHNAEIIKRHNAVVTNKDTVYFLGDFCFGGRNVHLAGEFNGNKKLVMGNHDMYNIDEYRKHFTKIYGACQFQNTILTHIPVHHKQLERFVMNIHGHLHNHEVTNKVMNMDGTITEVADWRYYNVSLEQIDLTPIPYDVIIDRWAENN